MELAWRSKTSKKLEGVLVAADKGQEWQLPWWWEHYSRHNRYPVTFVDLGLSEKALKWCKEKGECVPLPSYDLSVADKSQVDPIKVAEWESLYDDSFWKKRPLFFLKPLACLQTPYQKTLWLDLDCEVRCNLEEIFTTLKDHGFSISQDRNLSFKGSNKMLYNGGVIAFLKGHPLIFEWAKRAFDLNAFFYGDQELLSHLISIREEPIHLLSPLYQWSRFQQDSLLARIVHRHGDGGKQEIIRYYLERGLTRPFSASS